MTEALGVPAVFTIIVNGREFPISSEVKEATYDQIVETALLRSPREDEVLTVTYSTKAKGDSRRSGSLAPGEKTKLEDGMIFSCMDTSNA